VSFAAITLCVASQQVFVVVVVVYFVIDSVRSVVKRTEIPQYGFEYRWVLKLEGFHKSRELLDQLSKYKFNY
jgi:hypothetical protein